MKKLIFIMVVAVIATTSVHAQKKEAAASSQANIFSLGLEAALPLGDFGTVYSVGIGANAQVEHKIGESAGITLNVGYLSYSVKSAYGSGHSAFIPVLAGVKYYFSPKVYGHGQLGASFASGSNSSGTYFTYSPGVGFMLSKNFDALVKFVGISATGSSLNSIALRLAYNFGQ